MRLIILGTALLFACTSAHADWAWTKWDMTQQQIISEGGGSVVVIPSNKIKDETTFVGMECRLQSLKPHSAGGVIFNKTNFCFNGAGLIAVEMYAESDMSKFYQLDRELRAAFGAPTDSSNGSAISSRAFVDRNKGNAIRLRYFVDTVILEYKKISTDF